MEIYKKDKLDYEFSFYKRIFEIIDNFRNCFFEIFRFFRCLKCGLESLSDEFKEICC